MKEKRFSSLVNYINQNGVCSYEDICENFAVSMSTARRDINELAKKNIIKKVHGGVTSLNYTSASKIPGLLNKMSGNGTTGGFKSTLMHIGKLAASHVDPGDIIYVGSGLTALHMMPYLKDIPNLTILTNNIMVAVNDFEYDNNIIMLGGFIDYQSQTTSGISVTDYLERTNIFKAFMSCDGVDMNRGISNLSESEVAIKRCLIQTTPIVYMLADNTKIDKVSLFTFTEFRDIDYFITDKDPGNEYRKLLSDANVTLEY